MHTDASARVLFWSCPAGHTAVLWEADQAKCLECPMTSVETEELIRRGRGEQRQQDIQWLREQARKSRAAREVGSDADGDFPLVPARVLDAVAMMLTVAPISAPGDD